MATTPRLGIVELSESQAQKATYVNNGFLVIDAAVARVTGDTFTGGVKIAETAASSGSPVADLWVVEAADTGMTAGTEAQSITFDLSATRQFATGALTTQRALGVKAPTYGFVGASTLTNAATVAIDNAPQAGTNATITNSWALWVQAGGIQVGSQTTPGLVGISRAAVTSGAPNSLLHIASAADTGLTAGTECSSVKFDLSATRQWATGALATQRGFRVISPTYGFVGASTLTTAATVSISGAPIAGTNATLTNSYALWVEDGGVQIGSQAVSGTLGVGRAGQSGGVPAPMLHVVAPADLNLTNGTFNGDVIFDFGVNHKQFAGGGTIAGLDFFQINAGTIDCAAVQTIPSMATVHIVGNPSAGTNVTVTNSCALQVQGRVCLGNNIAQANSAGFTFQQARNSSQYNLFLIAPVNSGNLNASTESNLSNWNPNGTITWTAGALATQRENLYGQPTYAGSSAMTITDTATVAIAGAPAAGANMTLTNSYGLWVQAGGARIVGHLCYAGGSVVGAAAGTNAGTTPPAPVVTANGNDTRGNITFGTGTTASAGNMVVVTFNVAYSAACNPVVSVVPKNALTAALQLYVTSVSTTGFTLACGVAPANSQGNTVYSFDYTVKG